VTLPKTVCLPSSHGGRAESESFYLREDGVSALIFDRNSSAAPALLAPA
jgi:hypothetical protein